MANMRIRGRAKLSSLSLWAFRIAIIGACAFILTFIFQESLSKGRYFNLGSLVFLVPSCFLLIHYTMATSIFFRYINSRHSREASVSRWRLFFAGLDWVFLLGEASVSTFFAAIMLSREGGDIEAWLSNFVLNIAGLTQAVGTVSIWLLRTAVILLTRGDCLFAPFDHPSKSWTFAGARRGLAGEPLGIIYARFLFAVVFPYALVIFGVYAIILEPIQEAGLTPLRTYRSPDLPFRLAVSDPIWTIVTSFNLRHSDEDWSTVVQVTRLSDRSVLFPPCLPPVVDSSVTIVCPNRPNFYTFGFDSTDLLITVNFTALNTTSKSSHASIFFGLTNRQHLYGHVYREIRKKFAKPSASSLGAFAVGDVYFYFAFVWNDLYLAIKVFLYPSDLVPRINNTATLRLTGIDNPYSVWTIVEDYRDKSIFNGLAATGGLWTFLSGIFAFVFGGSLLFTLFGVKPLSTFGVVHRFQKQRIRNNYFPDASPGLAEFLGRYFINFGSSRRDRKSDAAIRGSLPTVIAESVHIVIKETLSLSLLREGGFKSMELKGEMTLLITDPSFAQIKPFVVLPLPDFGNNLQFKQHPNFAKFTPGETKVIALKDPTRSFPVNQSLGFLKWRYTGKGKSCVPLEINCWPTPINDGTCDVHVEYELGVEQMTLHDVVISIPLPSGSYPTVSSNTGDWALSRSHCLDWSIPLIDLENSSGALEFSVRGDGEGAFFPVTVIFVGQGSLAGIKVASVTKADGSGDVVFSTDSVLTVDDYHVV